MYNYMEAMKEDIRQAIENDYTLSDYENREELEEKLNDDLWIDDSVTGNASGSYTFNTATAAEYVQEGGTEYLQEAARDGFITSAEIGEKFINDEWEYLDVTIRCYLLGQAISAVLDEIDAEFMTEEEEEEAAEIVAG